MDVQRFGWLLAVLSLAGCVTANDRYLRRGREALAATDPLLAIANGLAVERTETDPRRRARAAELIDQAALLLAERASATPGAARLPPIPGFTPGHPWEDASRLRASPWCRQTCRVRVDEHIDAQRDAAFRRLEQAAMGAQRGPLARLHHAHSGLNLADREAGRPGTKSWRGRMNELLAAAYVDVVAEATRPPPSSRLPSFRSWMLLAALAPQSIPAPAAREHAARLEQLGAEALPELEALAAAEPGLALLATRLAARVRPDEARARAGLRPLALKSACPHVTAPLADVVIPAGAQVVVEVLPCTFEARYDVRKVSRKVANPNYLKRAPMEVSTHREYVGGKYDARTGTVSGIGQTRTVTTYTQPELDERREIFVTEEVYSVALTAVAPVRITVTHRGASKTQEARLEGTVTRDVDAPTSDREREEFEARVTRRGEAPRVRRGSEAMAKASRFEGPLVAEAVQQLAQAPVQPIDVAVRRAVGSLAFSLARQSSKARSEARPELAAWAALSGAMDDESKTWLLDVLGLAGTGLDLVAFLEGKPGTRAAGAEYPPLSTVPIRLPPPQLEAPSR